LTAINSIEVLNDQGVLAAKVKGDTDDEDAEMYEYAV
jgi:hypothetical protein